eukprot:1063085-Rhodomonas_salina.1
MGTMEESTERIAGGGRMRKRVAVGGGVMVFAGVLLVAAVAVHQSSRQPECAPPAARGFGGLCLGTVAVLGCQVRQ